MKRLLAIGGLGVMLSFSAHGAGVSLQPARLTGTLNVDGKLDEPAWQAAPPSSDFQRLELFRADKPAAKTTCKLLYDDDAVYLGVYCAEPSMSRVKEFPTGRDSDVFSMDCLEIFLDPEGRGFNYYQFALGINNAQWDLCWGERGHINREYNGLWTSAIYRGPDFWTAEIRIPLSDFYFTPASAFSDTWLVNVCRQRKPEWDLLTCAPLDKGFQEPDHFMPVGGMPKKKPAADLAVTKADIVLNAKTEKGYSGCVELEIACRDSAARGPYTLELSADGMSLGKKPVELAQDVNPLTLDGVAFAELKDVLLKVALTGRDGKPAGGALFPANLEYQPVAIDVTEPFYGHCIFPGQDAQTIAGKVTVNLAAGQIKKAKLRITLSGAGATNMMEQKTAEKTFAFSFPATNLAVGSYTLSAEVAAGGTVLAANTVKIRKLPPGNAVYIDRNLNFVVNGKPMIARGWYSEFYLVSRALNNQFHGRPNSQYVNLWGNLADLEAERIDPDPAEKERSRTPVRPSQKVFDGMKANIENARNNTNAWIYYLCDEPECRFVSPVYLKYQYDYVKELDPTRPVMIITRDPARYTGCADILNPHPYLSPTIHRDGTRTMVSPKEIRAQLKTVYRAGQGRIPAWLTPQAFSYGIMDRDADYPTFQEYNCMMYAALANGTKGFTPYIYFDHFNTPDLRLGCDFIYESIAYLEKFLLLSPASAPVTVNAPDDSVDVMIKQLNGQTLLMIVNLLDKPVSADVSSPVLKPVRKLFGFRDNREVAVKDGQFTLDLPAYGARVLSDPKLGAELKTEDKLREEIAAARRALQKPGNILFSKNRSIDWSSSAAPGGCISDKSLITLADGVCDSLGWANVGGSNPPWIEAIFPKFVAKFKSAKFYTIGIRDMEFYIWKDAEWKKAGEVKDNKDPVITLTFPEQLSTVKIRIAISKGDGPEVYEVELYE